MRYKKSVIRKILILLMCCVVIYSSIACSFDGHVSWEEVQKDDLPKSNIEKKRNQNFEVGDSSITREDSNWEEDVVSEEAAFMDFYWENLNEEVKERITGYSYPDTTEPIEITYEDLAYVHIRYCDFDNQDQEGEIICNKKIADDLVEIFQELYNNRYQIEKIKLIDEYQGDDMSSMTDNNTSSFNYRVVSGKKKLSNHAYGLAIDINPRYNPYIFYQNGEKQVQPLNGVEFVDRGKDFAHKIDHEDLCYRLFIEHGFTWGGDWKNVKDYQHFQKTEVKGNKR